MSLLNGTIAIVKVQVPLYPPGSNVALVYARGRTFMQQIEASPEVLAAMDGAPKAFFVATMKQGVWVIGKRVADENW